VLFAPGAGVETRSTAVFVQPRGTRRRRGCV